MTLVFDCLTQSVRPDLKKGQYHDLNGSKKDKPFDSTLLSASFATHELTNLAPEYIIVNILSLPNGHIGNNLRQLLFFLFRPGT
jgi:hypothetical protein